MIVLAICILNAQLMGISSASLPLIPVGWSVSREKGKLILFYICQIPQEHCPKNRLHTDIHLSSWIQKVNCCSRRN